MPRMRWLLVGSSALFAVSLLAACGGDGDGDAASGASGDGSNGAEVSSEDAEAILTAMLLRAEDLPGEGWVAAAGDDAEQGEPEDDDPFADAEACEGFDQLGESETPGHIAGQEPVLGLENEFERSEQSEGDFPAISQLVSAGAVYASEDAAKTVLDAIRGAIDPSDLERCFQEAFTSQLAEDVGDFELEASASASSAETTDGGVATRVDLTIKFLFSIDVAAEIHAFQRGAAVGYFVVIDIGAEGAAPVAADLVDTMADRLASALG